MPRQPFTHTRLAVLAGLATGLLTVVLASCGGAGQTDPLAMPTGVKAAAGPGYITVTWQDNGTTETGFEIYRSPSGAAASQAAAPLASVPADSTTYVDFDIDLGTSYDYSVVAVRGTTKSGAAAAVGPASVTVGVDLMVGTINRADPTLTAGTAIVIYLMLPADVRADPDVPISYTLTGPPGWNRDVAINRTLAAQSSERSQGFGLLEFTPVNPLVGTYTLTATVGGNEYQATAVLQDSDYRLPKAHDLKVVSATSQALTADWDSAPGAVVEYPRLFKGGFNGVAATYLISGFAPGMELPLGDLSDGVHALQLISSNSAVTTYPLKVEPFGMSHTTAVFGVGNVPLGSCGSLDQTVTVPDASLRLAIANAISKQSGELTCLELLAVESILTYDAGITSLQGLEYAANLKRAYFSNLQVGGQNPNRITDLEPLASLDALVELSLIGNPIVDLTPIEHKTSMTALLLTRTAVTSIAFLADFEALQNLQIGYAPISDLSPIYGMTQLMYVGIEGFGITDISFLADFDDLSWVWLADNSIASLAALVANPSLGTRTGDYVDIRRNGLDLEDASVMADIQTLIDRGVGVSYTPQE